MHLSKLGQAIMNQVQREYMPFHSCDWTRVEEKFVGQQLRSISHQILIKRRRILGICNMCQIDKICKKSLLAYM